MASGIARAASGSPPRSGANLKGFMGASGSSWDTKQFNYFEIKPRAARIATGFPSFLANFRTSCLQPDIQKRLKEVGSGTLTQLDHQKLSMGFGGELSPAGTMVGPFYAFLAMVKEIPHDEAQDVARQHPKRDTKPVQRPGYVRTDSLELEGSSPEMSSDDDGDKSYTAKSEDTDQSSHERRKKPEIVTQVTLILFNQVVYEGSDLNQRGTRQRTPEVQRLEWHITPTKFYISAPRVGSTSISDGSLFWKRYDSNSNWVMKDPLVYCSVELSEYDRTLDLALKLGKLDLDNKKTPTLDVFETHQYNLSNPDDREQAAKILLAMGEYHGQNGPLLKDWVSNG
ncbi:predicted protein [Uncinocarpus reesii 1704]|uniref:Uncharacterized protein n=1 Tax=Uncinocarpus reesii (strain UAMH 1704) TaxID=336963 RepID=C4JYK9_UNCRE|nr:uncharacterized protein UREG_07260 [Uncinocarpus reesii 1704]EEP82395.1 predicted protein [Uncinocarpus reesii 1704]